MACRLLDIGFSAENKASSDDVFTLPDSEEQSFSQYLTEMGPNPSTYGEVTTLGARQLFYYMGMTTKERDHPPTHQPDTIVFCDLGMGRGKLVVQAFLELIGIITPLIKILNRNKL